MGLLKQTKAVLNKPLETTQPKELKKPKAASSLLYPPPEAQHIPAQALQTHTHRQTHTTRGFSYINMGIIQSDMASLKNILWDCVHRWLMYHRCGLLFVPDLQHFGRSVDSNKGLLNNRFHSQTHEGPTWPRGVSCSFEHLNPHAASDFPLLFTGGCSSSVFPCVLSLWKGSSGLCRGRFQL